MADQSMRDELIEKIRAMSDEQVSALLQTARAMDSGDTASDSDTDHDPAVGFLKNAPPDYSERAKDILRGEVDVRGGWTQKDKLE